MKEELLENIDNLVKSIYELSTKEIETGFIQMLDNIEPLVSTEVGIDWNTLLINIQEAYVNKNYVELADLLLYELKVVFG